MKVTGNRRQMVWMITAVMSVITVILTAAQDTSAQWTTDTSSNNIYYNSGNVGIGTSSPVSLFQVRTATNRNVGVRDHSVGTQIYGGNDANSAYAGLIIDGAPLLLNSFSGGNVGIGTTSPGYLLDLKLAGSGTGSTIGIGDITYGTYGTIGFATVGSKFQLTGTAGQALTLGSNGANDRFYLDTSGNVGIGTTAPAVPFHVSSPSANTASFRIDNVAATGGRTYDFNPFISGVSNGGFELRDVTAGVSRIAIDSSGNVGIGTTSPAYPFQAYNASANNFNIQSQRGSGAGIGLWTSTALGALYTTNNFPLELGVNGSSDIAINTSHNVGIGTTSPGAKLAVYGSPSTTVPAFQVASTGSLANNDILRVQINGLTNGLRMFQDASANVVYSFEGGNVGIGNTNPQYKLDVSGTINSNSTITANNIVAKYQDVAEWVESSEQLAAGTVVVLDSTKSNQVISSTTSYDTRVAGVISAQPGITLGEKGDNKVLVATTGRVKIKVDASKSPIRIGDLLVTSDIPGLAMKSESIELAGRKMHMPGTLIGKALEPLESGSGAILVLLSLQ